MGDLDAFAIGVLVLYLVVFGLIGWHARRRDRRR
jgi:hypothetical protein